MRNLPQTAAAIGTILTQISGDEMLLFKDKINYKLPNSNGFKAHLDAPAYDHVGRISHLTANIAVDASTPENGCLEVVPGSHTISVPLAEGEGGRIDPRWEEQANWVQLPLRAGDIVLFGSHLAHRSAPNKTDTSRASVYATYHCKKDGLDLRERYYADRRVNFPPEYGKLGYSNQHKLQLFQEAVEEIAEKLSLSELLVRLKRADNMDQPHRNSPSQSPEGHSPENEDPARDEATGRWEVSLDLQSGLGDAPGSCFSQISPTPGSRRAQRGSSLTDIISEGLLPLESAEKYFATYKQRFDHFIYRVPGEWYRSLKQDRESSPLLTSVLCAVGALHSASTEYDVCYRHFITLVGRRIFAKHHTIHDVLAFLIGAYWLSDLSWTLISNAVKISTELQLWRNTYSIAGTDKAHYLSARVYFLVFVCDHHFSIPYGRLPLTRQDDTIKSAHKILTSPHSIEDDFRLVFQVQLWSMTENMSTTFGINTDGCLTASMVPHLHRFSIQLDSFRSEWSGRWVPNAFIGNYARKGAVLYYHFAKLYLYSHALRGLGKQDPSATVRATSEIGLDIDEFANAAVLSATAIIRTVLNDPEVQSFIDGFHTYFHIMTAFAVVFLLKVSTSYSVSIHVDAAEIRKLVERLLVIIKGVVPQLHPKHLLITICNGIEQLLRKLSASMQHDLDGQSRALSRPLPGTLLPSMAMSEGGGDWGGFDAFDPFMSEFDFLSSQPPMDSFMYTMSGEDMLQ
ncbi:hypothetical protein PV11_01564 [Exophiala sideris]|uniref:Transcription factor domain-containing protein n=1 Tax=Exophiala sideris TaxID=1016849 RepID=A0A0D1ZGI9_9EURO|nr:hypothetical protein PV11_01564 [Exophiala sideris]